MSDTGYEGKIGRRKFIAGVGGGLAAGAVGGATILPSRAVAQKAINIGLITSDHYSPVFIGLDKNWFEEVGLKPRRHVFTAGGPLVEGIIAGKLDMAWIGTVAIIALGRGYPLVSVMGIAREGSGLLAARPEIRRIEDLAGKTVGIPARGTTAHVVLWKALKVAGLDISKVRLLEIPDPKAMQVSLERREIDAVCIWEPWLATLELNNVGRVLATLRDFWPNFQCDFMLVRKDFLNDHPEAVQGAIEVVLRGMSFLGQDLGTSVEIVSRTLKVPQEVERVAIRRQIYTPVIQRENLMEQYDFLKEVAILKPEQVPSWERFVDTKMYDHALKRWEALRKA